MSPAVLYQGIDTLPIYHWFRIHETGDLNLLIVRDGKRDKSALLSRWNELYNEFIDTFGIDEHFLSILEIKKEIEILKIDMAVSEDRYYQTFIDIKEQELKELFDQQNSVKFNETSVYIEKWLGFRLQEKKTTVKEYYTYLRAMEKELKTAKRIKSNG